MNKKLFYFGLLLLLEVELFAAAPLFKDFTSVCTNSSCYIEGTIYISEQGESLTSFTPDQDVDLEIWLGAESTGELLYSKQGYFKKDVIINIKLRSDGIEIQEGSNSPENILYTFNKNVTLQFVLVLKNASSEKATKDLSMIVDNTPPEPPTGLYASAGDRSAIVHWSQSSSTDVKYYNVYYRQEGQTDFTLFGSTKTGTETSLIVTGLENGITYEFGVSSVDRVLNEGSINSVQDDGQPVKTTPQEIVGLHGLSPEEEGGCFIASAVFSEDSQEVALLREFRDRFLLTNAPGRAFVRFYYKFSPPVANYIRSHQWLKILGKVLLYPVLLFSYIITKGQGILLFGIVTIGILGIILVYQKRREQD